MPDTVADSFYREARQIASSHAQRFILTLEDRDDFALGFVLRILQCSALASVINLPPEARRAYLRCAAHRYALNFVRDRTRIREFETQFPECDSDDDRHDFNKGDSLQPCFQTLIEPETSCLQNRMKEELIAILRLLPPESSSLITMRYFEGRNSTEIAAKLSCTPESVRQALSAARKKIRVLLEKRGWDEEELNFFFQIFA